MRKLWADTTLSNAEIARRLNISASLLSSWSQRLELPPRRPRKLTPEVEAKLRELWATDLTIEAIAERLAVSSACVRNWRNVVHLAPRRRGRSDDGLTPEVKAELHKLWKDTTLTRAEIAFRLNISRTTLDSYRARLKLPLR